MSFIRKNVSRYVACQRASLFVELKPPNKPQQRGNVRTMPSLSAHGGRGSLPSFFKCLMPSAACSYAANAEEIVELRPPTLPACSFDGLLKATSGPGSPARRTIPRSTSSLQKLGINLGRSGTLFSFDPLDTPRLDTLQLSRKPSRTN